MSNLTLKERSNTFNLIHLAAYDCQDFEGSVFQYQRQASLQLVNELNREQYLSQIQSAIVCHDFEGFIGDIAVSDNDVGYTMFNNL
jgi:hypothetical protein